MKCGSCFRCTEDWKDVKAKGLKPQCTKPLRSVKPRDGVKVHCTDAMMKAEITPNSRACKNWEHRAVWNFKLRFSIFKSVAKRRIRVPLGRLRKPVRLAWVDELDGVTDSIIRNAIPECPHCGEMPYSTKRCVFCGQRFIQDDRTAEFNKPPETVRLNCPSCGGKNTLVGTRSKINGHFHGKCEKCGTVFIQ